MYGRSTAAPQLARAKSSPPVVSFFPARPVESSQPQPSVSHSVTSAPSVVNSSSLPASSPDNNISAIKNRPQAPPFDFELSTVNFWKPCPTSHFFAASYLRYPEPKPPHRRSGANMTPSPSRSIRVLLLTLFLALLFAVPRAHAQAPLEPAQLPARTSF